jgi:hypothetical protein
MGGVILGAIATGVAALIPVNIVPRFQLLHLNSANERFLYYYYMSSHSSVSNHDTRTIFAGKFSCITPRLLHIGL